MPARRDINPCPFCGHGRCEMQRHYGAGFYFARCPECGAHGPVSKDEDMAVLYWNAANQLEADKAAKKE